MAGKVVFGQFYEFGRGEGRCAGENLRVDMTGQLLHPYLIESSFGRNCENLDMANG